MASAILVVDDRPGIRRLLQEVLQDAEYRVITAAGGREALDIVEQTHVDLVLLDMKMSGMDGVPAKSPTASPCASESEPELTAPRRRQTLGFLFVSRK